MLTDAAVAAELVSIDSSFSLPPGPLSPGSCGGMVPVAWLSDSLLSFRINRALFVALWKDTHLMRLKCD